MDKSQAIRIVKRELPRYKKILNLPHWVFSFEYSWIGDSDDMIYGQCIAEPDYNSALITINVQLIEDEESLCRTIRHEMLHVLHSAFEVYRKAVAKILTNSEFNALDVLWGSCAESTVKQLEFSMGGMGIPVIKEKPKKKKRKHRK